MCFTESSHEICQVFPRKCVLLETWADLISFSQSLRPSGGGRWRLLGVWRKSDQLTGAVPRNPGNHSTYPPPKKKKQHEKWKTHLIACHQLSKPARFNFTLHGFQSALEILEWYLGSMSRSQLSSYPSGPTQRRESLYVHNPRCISRAVKSHPIHDIRHSPVGHDFSDFLFLEHRLHELPDWDRVTYAERLWK